jgi:hypothetical protein
MKIQRFNEDKFSDDYESSQIAQECKILFKNLWMNKLDLGVISVLDHNHYDLRVCMYKELNSETYKVFNELFEFLDQLNMKFEINHEQWKIIIDIKNMDEFINEMKIRLNINKYNI